MGDIDIRVKLIKENNINLKLYLEIWLSSLIVFFFVCPF